MAQAKKSARVPPPAGVLRVFLSSTAQDLEAHRDRLAEAIERMGHLPVRMETFGARPGPPLDECRDLAVGVDALVVCVAHRYGWVPSKDEDGDGEKSITWHEVEAAMDADPPVPVFAFLVDEEAAWSGGKEQDQLKTAGSSEEMLAVGKAVQNLEHFKKFLGSKFVRDTFTSPDDLALKFSTSLARWLGAQAARSSSQPPEAQGSPAAARAALSAAELAYLRQLRVECNHLPLGEESREKSPRGGRRVSLANVYVDLETTQAPDLPRVLARLGVPEGERRTRLLGRLGGRGLKGAPEGEGGELLTALLGEGEAQRPGGELDENHPLRPWAKDEATLRHAFRPVSALEALAEHRHLVLLGDPGSGKSTFINHLAAGLVGPLLGEEAGGEALPAELFPEPLFPVRVVLRRWSSRLEAGAAGDAGLVYDACQQQGKEVARERWIERLDDPHTLVLFDGLDEVPAAERGSGEPDRRKLVLDAIEAFREAHPACRVLLTCRVKPYQGLAARLEGLPAFTLAPLDDPRVRRFAERWYAEMAAVGRLETAAAERCKRLLAALASRPVLRQMAGTPLLLTMLAQVNARAVLPESRAELYHQCTEQLLWEWERRVSEGGGVASLLSLLESAGGGLQRSDVERVLCELTWERHGACGKEVLVDLEAEKLEKALAAIHPREFEGKAWAARVVALMRERGGLLVAVDDATFTFPHRSFQEYLAARWILLGGNPAAEAARLAASDVWWEVVELACGYLTFTSRYGEVQAMVSELLTHRDDPGRLLLAGRVWREFTPRRAAGGVGEELRRQVPEVLTSVMQDAAVPPPQRLEAGETAADLGALPEDLDAWVEIPDDCGLGYAFKIGKYPVTNAQYRRFVEAGGYEREKPWWTEEARREIQKERKRWPEDLWLRDNPRFNRPTQPVAGVSWGEAMAYCAWWTDQQRERGDIEPREAIRLPTMAEWHRAAAGTDGKRRHPWGEHFDPARANRKESQLGRPTPVHMYPSGASPEGVFDLWGNVPEWTSDRHEKREGYYTLAGRSYWDDERFVPADARFFIIPGYETRRLYGFRCVIVSSRS